MAATTPSFKVRKDPAEDLDYKIDYSRVFTIDGGDTISTSNWAVTSPATDITTHNASNTTDTATIWASGGTLGRRYWLTNTVVTTGGRTYERTVEIKIENK